MDSPVGLIDSIRGNVGKSVDIAPDATTLVSPFSLGVFPIPPGSPVGKSTLLNLSTEDEKSEVVTITLDNPNPFNAPLQESVVPNIRVLARTVAEIEWGNSGVQSRAFVDFDHGLTFSLPASFLRVTGINLPLPAKIANLQGTGIDVRGRNVKLGSFCGYGTSSGTKNSAAKLTLYYDNVGQFGVVPRAKIPDFATNLIVYRVADTSPMTVNVYDEGGIPVLQVSVAAGVSMTSPIELPGDAAFVDVPIAGVMTSIRYIFGISF